MKSGRTAEGGWSERTVSDEDTGDEVKVKVDEEAVARRVDGK